MFLNILSNFRRNSRRAVGYRTARDEFRVGTPRLEPEAVALRYVFEEQEAERRREERDAVREADRQDPEPAAATRARAASVAFLSVSRRRCGGVNDGIVAWRRHRRDCGVAASTDCGDVAAALWRRHRRHCGVAASTDCGDVAAASRRDRGSESRSRVGAAVSRSRASTPERARSARADDPRGSRGAAATRVARPDVAATPRRRRQGRCPELEAAAGAGGRGGVQLQKRGPDHGCGGLDRAAASQARGAEAALI